MKIVAITSCPTGIAHTYMAAEALEMAAKEMGHQIKVETQGSVGAENVLTEKDIAEANCVIIAADTNVSKDRFVGKALVEVAVSEAIKDAKGLIEKAKGAKVLKAEVSEETNKDKKEGSSQKKGVYKHLMTGVSYMIPFVVAGGILIALGFAFGGIYVYENVGSFGEVIFSTGKAAFGFMVPVLAGFIAYSIADRPGIVPGFVGGALANTIGAGFLGALLAGFIAGYVVIGIRKYIKLPKSMDGLMPVLIIPVLSTFIIAIIMTFVLGGPVKAINDAMNSGLVSLSGSSKVLLGLILGIMMAADMGGPINKAAYVFGTATLANGSSSAIMAAVMVAGMVPPLGIALATVISKKKFTVEEREAGKANWVMGLAFITEGAIPFAAADPVRVIPSLMAGSGVAGALSMLFNVTLAVPHGGAFVLALPNVVTGLGMYLIAMVAGTVVSGVLLSALKKEV